MKLQAYPVLPGLTSTVVKTPEFDTLIVLAHGTSGRNLTIEGEVTSPVFLYVVHV
jgi:putative alpha-1,2-mannosidase